MDAYLPCPPYEIEEDYYDDDDEYSEDEASDPIVGEQLAAPSQSYNLESYHNPSFYHSSNTQYQVDDDGSGDDYGEDYLTYSEGEEVGDDDYEAESDTEWACNLQQDCGSSLNTGNSLWTLQLQQYYGRGFPSSSSSSSPLSTEHPSLPIQFSLPNSIPLYQEDLTLTFPFSLIFPSLIPDTRDKISYPRYNHPQPVRILYRELNPTLRGGNGTMSRSTVKMVLPLVILQHWAVEVGTPGNAYLFELKYQRLGSELVVTPPGDSLARKRYKKIPYVQRLSPLGTTTMQVEEIRRIAQQLIETRPRYLLGVSDCQNFAIDLTSRIVQRPSVVFAAAKTIKSSIRPVAKIISPNLTRFLEQVGVITPPPVAEAWKMT